MSCQISSRLVRLAQAESLGYPLPFLYCTHTILSTVRPHAINSKLRARENGCSSRCSYSTSQPKRTPNTRSIFEDDGFLRKSSAPFGTGTQEEAPKARRSTLTNAEQAAFDAIWTKSDERQQHSIDDDKAEADRPLHDLNELFEHAIQQIETRERRDAERAARDRSYFQEMKARPFLEVFRDIPSGGEEKMDGSDVRLLEESNEHRERITKLLKAANSAMDVWNVLESEVFSMVEQLQQQLAHQEKADKKQRKPRKKKGTTKGSSEAVMKNEESQESKAVAPQNATSPLLNETNALPTNAILTNLQENYAYYNLLALRIWRRHHSTSTYALQLLPRIKSLGPISYVLGASTSLYNEVLFVKWMYFNDLRGIADLLTEMSNQGIEPNILTLSFLRFISRTRNADLAGQSGSALQSWWNMRAVNEGWQRVREIALQVQADVYKREREEQEEQANTEKDDEQSWNTKMQNALDEQEDKTEETPEPSKESSFRVKRVSWAAAPSRIKKQTIRKVSSDSDRYFFEVRQNKAGGRPKSTIS